MAREFIALEGGEGVGKTTQMRLLKERLPVLFPGHDFVFTREPGGTSFSDKIRELILSEDAKNADGKTMFGLFAAARAEHIRRVIGPAFGENKTVICDRYVAATYAYQAYAQDGAIERELFDAYFETLDYKPDLTIILDLDPAVARERVISRVGQSYTHFDARPLEFHELLRKGYASFEERYRRLYGSVKIIDADQSVEVLHEEIVKLIQPILI